MTTTSDMARTTIESPRKTVHPAIVRITHWINAVAMLVMIGSGWEIYNASPLFAFTYPGSITLGTSSTRIASTPNAASFDGSRDVAITRAARANILRATRSPVNPQPKIRTVTRAERAARPLQTIRPPSARRS